MVTAHLATPVDLTTNGAVLAGDHHLFVDGEPRRDIYFRRRSSGFIFCECAQSASSSVIVAHHDDTMQAGACRAAASKLAEHLSGSARSKVGGRWPTVVDPFDKSGDDPPPMSAAEWEAEKRLQWQQQVERWEASETRRALRDGRHEGSSIEVSHATLDARYNGSYHYHAARQSWRHVDDQELSITFGHSHGETSGYDTLHPRWCIGHTTDARLPYYSNSYSLENGRWAHGHPGYRGEDGLSVRYVRPSATLKQLTVRRHAAIKGSHLEYILVEVSEDATVEQLALLVKSRWLEESPMGTPPAWLSELRSRAGNDDEAWGIKILSLGMLLQPERMLEECAADAAQPALGFWGDFANSHDFVHGGVAAVAVVAVPLPTPPPKYTEAPQKAAG